MRSNGTVSAFATLSPRQAILPAPYAFWAANASQAVTVSGTVPSSGLNGLYSNPVSFNNPANGFAGDGSGLANVNATALGGRSAAQFWQTGGNAGTAPGTSFLGTTDNQPLQFKVNNQVGLRLEYPTAGTVPNLVGGYSGNSVDTQTQGAVIAGGGGFESANTIGMISSYSAIGGGSGNSISFFARYSTVTGGASNDIGSTSSYSTIGGGVYNRIASSSAYATIAGGTLNDIGSSSSYCVIGGGVDNNIATSSFYSTIAGGKLNDIGGGVHYSSIGGGSENKIPFSARYAVIPGGESNVVGANAWYALAAGRRAKANHPGAFVWADSTDADFASTATNQFLIRASGNVGINTPAPADTLHVNGSLFVESDRGVRVSAFDGPLITRGWHPFAPNAPASKIGHGRWGLFMESYALIAGIPDLASSPPTYFAVAKYQTNGVRNNVMTVDNLGNLVTLGTVNGSSDRARKENFAPVSAQDVLARVTALPITRWNYRGEPGTVHIGPVAQDFHAAFAVGMDDRHISMVDADGVALAAIQGLNQKLEAEVKSKDTRIAELEKRLSAIEALLKE